MPIHDYKFRKEINKEVKLAYRLSLPYAYEERNEKKWPLILFLHGIKKRGEDLRVLDGYGLTGIAENDKNFEFIVVTPQCPSFSSWLLERDSVMALLDEIISTYRVDSERVYLSGFSMGGAGVWDLAAHSPELFAAIVPLAGRFHPEQAHLLDNVPIWAFHGEDDDVIPVERTVEMVEALEKIGGNVQCTIYPGLKHNVMKETYGNPELYKWLLNHKKQT